jgi:hypothetical protein
MKVEMICLKEINEKQRNSSYSELRKKEELDNIKKNFEFSDINIDVNSLKEENKLLTRNNSENNSIFSSQINKKETTVSSKTKNKNAVSSVNSVNLNKCECKKKKEKKKKIKKKEEIGIQKDEDI